MGKVKILKAGLMTSIQDQGRFGWRRYGVPLSGAMDLKSAALANLLLNNPAEAPLLEVTQTGPKLIFDESTIIVVTGADLSPKINGENLELNKITAIAAGDQLVFGKPKYGVRCYLGVKGGWSQKKLLGSASQYAPVTKTGHLSDGDEVPFQTYSDTPSPLAKVAADLDHFNQMKLEVQPGPEFGLLSQQMQQVLLESTFSVGYNDRMAYQLTSEEALKNDLSIITSPVLPGIIQLTPSGTLLALMRDAQVTGGYPRVLMLTENVINVLAQKRMGEKVRFTIDEKVISH